MYAVVSSGGKQYRVEPGTTLTVERLAADRDGTVTFDRVLLVGDGDEITVGTPVVSGATVSGTILGEALGPKIVVFKFKQKVKYRRRTGHRQHLVRVRIDGITANGRTVSAEESQPAPAAKAKPKRSHAERGSATRGRSSSKAGASKADAETDGDATESAPARRRSSPKAAAAKGDTEPKAKPARGRRSSSARTSASTKREPKE